MSDLLAETSIHIADRKPDYYELSLLVKEKGSLLSDDITLEALINWKKEKSVNKKNTGEVTEKLEQPPSEWVDYIQSLNTREQQMVRSALGAAFRSGIISLKQIREIPQGKLEGLIQNNQQKVGPQKAEFLKNAFSIPKAAASY